MGIFTVTGHRIEGSPKEITNRQDHWSGYCVNSYLLLLICGVR